MGGHSHSPRAKALGPLQLHLVLLPPAQPRPTGWQGLAGVPRTVYFQRNDFSSWGPEEGN